MKRLEIVDAGVLFQNGTILLDTIRGDAENTNSLLFTAPREILSVVVPEQVSTVLNGIDAAVAAGYHVAGFLAYEAGYTLDDVRRVPASAGQPLAWFGIYDAPLELHPDEVDTLLEPFRQTPVVIPEWRFALTPDEYRERIEAIKGYIREGDAYQINFTSKLNFGLWGQPIALYTLLRERQRVPYGAFLQTDKVSILSLSPELFFRTEGNRILTRPMKGTAPRGQTPTRDRAQAEHLRTDEKNRAENLMIVDLLRNDLSRVCTPGSVHVPDLFATEQHETLIQMTSTVEGRLNPDTTFSDIFGALFPCGSVTGAPKLRATQIIHDLEAGPRGVYCGAIGYISPNNKAVFNVAIRTAVLSGNKGEMGVGSGIVWDSDPDEEYRECLLKARFLTGLQPSEFELIETMRCEHDIPLLELHLDRMRASAAFFRFPFPEETIRAQLARVCHEPGNAMVRLTLAADGTFTIITKPLPVIPEPTWRVTLSGHTTSSTDVFLLHKTTRRERYESEYRQATDAGFDEVLFMNERGEVTEGSRTNLIVRIGDRFLTPPVSCGLLGGVYRRHLLDTRKDITERVLHPDDLNRADALYLCNAVRGLVEATFQLIR